MLAGRLLFYVFIFAFVVLLMNVTSLVRYLNGREHFPYYNPKPRNYDQIQEVKTGLCWMWFMASIVICAVGSYFLIPMMEAEVAARIAEQAAR